MTDYQTQVEEYISTNYPDATVGDVLGTKEIIPQNFRILLGTLPYRMLVRGTTHSEMPDDMRHKIKFEVKKDIFDDLTGTPINIIKSLPELAGKKITLSYSPATQEDAQVLITYGYYEAPPYLVNLIPILMINGEPIAEGSSIIMGNLEDLTVSFMTPSGSDRVTHSIVASSFISIGLDIQRVTKQLLEERKLRFEEAVNKLGIEDVRLDDVIGELLNLHTLTYFYMVEAFNELSSIGKVAYLKISVEMTASLTPKVEYLYGAYSISKVGTEVDVKRYVTARKSLTGVKEQEKEFMLMTGTISSALEHGVFEALHEGVKGVSAVKIIAAANEQGIPVYNIDSTNSDSILPKLQVSGDTLSDIMNAVASGKKIIVPERSIQYYDWYGDGYIITDPDTGAGAFMIFGGLAGGGTAEEYDPLKDPLLEILRALGVGVSSGKIEIFIRNNPGIASAVDFFRKAAGHAALAIGAIINFSEMYSETGELWKGVTAAAISVFTGILIAKLLPLFMVAFAGTGIGAVLIIAWFLLAMYIMEKLILNLIKEVYYWRQKKYFAVIGIKMKELPA